MYKESDLERMEENLLKSRLYLFERRDKHVVMSYLWRGFNAEIVSNTKEIGRIRNAQRKYKGLFQERFASPAKEHFV